MTSRKRDERMYMVLDIETVGDPHLPFVPKLRKDGEPSERDQMPPPPHHRVVCAAYWFVSVEPAASRGPSSLERALRFGVEAPERVVSFPSYGVASDLDAGEAALLEQLVSTMADTDVDTVVGYNTRRFDIPVIAARCMRHGISFPWWYGPPLGNGRTAPRYRYAEDRHLDLCDQLSDYGNRSASLDVWARHVGLPGKVGDIDGKHVAEALAAGRQRDVERYCLADAWQTAGVLLRWLLLRGQLTVAEYRPAARELLDNMLSAGAEVHGELGDNWALPYLNAIHAPTFLLEGPDARVVEGEPEAAQ